MTWFGSGPEVSLDRWAMDRKYLKSWVIQGFHPQKKRVWCVFSHCAEKVCLMSITSHKVCSECLFLMRVIKVHYELTICKVKHTAHTFISLSHTYIFLNLNETTSMLVRRVGGGRGGTYHWPPRYFPWCYQRHYPLRYLFSWEWTCVLIFHCHWNQALTVWHMGCFAILHRSPSFHVWIPLR